MEIVLAEAMGWCFGVRDAVSLALAHPERGDMTVVGELVHDETVVARLRAAGLRFVRGFDEPITTRHALITAHGASRAAIASLEARGLIVTEATCPLVTRAHSRLASLVAEGRHPVVVGLAGHVEVLGLVGDFPGASVLESAADVGTLPAHPSYGVVAQTTQVLENVLAVVAAIRRAHPHASVRLADTICHPTKDRQAAVRRLAAQVDRVVVIGGPASHNTRRLVLSCAAMGVPADRVQRPEELDASLYRHVARVGVTAGTSAPDEAIAAVLARLREIARELATAETTRPDAPASVSTPTPPVLAREAAGARA